MRSLQKLLLSAAFCAVTLVAGAQSFYINDSGVIRKAQRIYVNDSGTIREVQRIYVNDSGVIRQVYLNAVFALPAGVYDQGTATGTNHSQGNINFFTNGTFTSTGENVGTVETGNWITPTSLAPGSYTIRAHLDSGTTPSGSAMDTDLALSSNRTWTINQAGTGGPTTANLTFTLKDGGGVTVKTGTASITAEVLPF